MKAENPRQLLPVSILDSPILQALVGSSLVSTALYLVRVFDLGSTRYGFMLWNLFLAWVPLAAAWLLRETLKRHSWKNIRAIILTAVWMGFLPNSFYLVSDLIHLFYSTLETNVLYDVVMLMSFVWNGLALGFISLHIVHRALRRRLSGPGAAAIAYAVLLACSYAIYLGRYLRWNSWDILINPFGLVFDVSDRLINPGQYPDMFMTTLSFFMLLGSMYFLVWRLYVYGLRAQT